MPADWTSRGIIDTLGPHFEACSNASGLSLLRWLWRQQLFIQGAELPGRHCRCVGGTSQIPAANQQTLLLARMVELNMVTVRGSA